MHNAGRWVYAFTEYFTLAFTKGWGNAEMIGKPVECEVFNMLRKQGDEILKVLSHFKMSKSRGQGEMYAKILKGIRWNYRRACHRFSKSQQTQVWREEM